MAEQNDLLRQNGLLTCREVADMKKVHLHSVYRAIKENRLKAERIQKMYVIPRDEAERWRAKSGRYDD